MRLNIEQFLGSAITCSAETFNLGLEFVCLFVLLKNENIFI